MQKQLAKVKEEKHAEKIVRSMYLAMTIDIEYYVCGISMLKNNIVLLTWSKPETEVSIFFKTFIEINCKSFRTEMKELI